MRFAAFATMPIRALVCAVVRDVFDRFDADDSGTLDRAEFRAMMRAPSLRRERRPHAPLIFCAGELANPSAHPELAERMRLERLYRTPYRPRSAPAKAIAKKTKMNKPVYGGIDLLELSVLTEDSDEELLRCSDEDEDSAAGGGRAPRARARDVGVGAASLTSAGIGHSSSRRFKKGHAAHSSRRYASRAQEARVPRALRALACLFLPRHVHPDEYHQSVEIAAADVLGARAAPRAWEFDEAAPARSALVPGLAAAWPLAIARETARRGGASREDDARGLPRRPSALGSPRRILLPRSSDALRPPRPLVVFLAPRLGLFALSFALESGGGAWREGGVLGAGGKTTCAAARRRSTRGLACERVGSPRSSRRGPSRTRSEAGVPRDGPGDRVERRRRAPRRRSRKRRWVRRRVRSVRVDGGADEGGAWTRFTFVAFAAPSAAIHPKRGRELRVRLLLFAPGTNEDYYYY